jgi:Ubiquitin-2 like Rad60 SUMO-like
MDRNASHPQENGARDISMKKGIPTSPRSPRRWLDIHVSFADLNHLENVTFRLEPHTAMRDLMRHACDQLEISEHSFRFFYEGMRLHRDDTPSTVSRPSPFLVGGMPRTNQID